MAKNMTIGDWTYSSGNRQQCVHCGTPTVGGYVTEKPRLTRIGVCPKCRDAGKGIVNDGTAPIAEQAVSTPKTAKERRGYGRLTYQSYRPTGLMAAAHDYSRINITVKEDGEDVAQIFGTQGKVDWACSTRDGVPHRNSAAEKDKPLATTEEAKEAIRQYLAKHRLAK
jgi:hypothetical protein